MLGLGLASVPTVIRFVRPNWVPTELFAQETNVQRSNPGIKKKSTNVCPEARTSEILFKPMKEQVQRMNGC